MFEIENNQKGEDMQKQKAERRQFSMIDKAHLRPGLFQAASNNRPHMAYEDSFELKTLWVFKGDPLSMVSNGNSVAFEKIVQKEA